MRTNTVTIDAARAAKVQLKACLAGVPGIVGVGLTRKGSCYAVKVTLQDDHRSQVPDSVAGIPVVVEVVGRVKKRRAGHFIAAG